LAICSSQHGHDRVMVPGLDALRSFNQLLLRHPRAPGAEPHNYQIKLRVDTPCHLPFQSGTIHVEGVIPEGQNCANFKKDQELPLEISYLDAQVLSSASNQMLSLCVRNWQPGDQLQRVGQRQPEKIKALFQEGRVLLWERRHWPVVMAGNEIVWVRQFGSAAKFAASAENPHRILLTYCKSGG
jgi:tRNA(Ile)-lysidine synthase